MTAQRERELIRRAIDQRFSGMQANPWLADRVMQIDRGEIKVKKKLSVGFVLVIVFSLLAVTALGALTLSWDDASKFLRKQFEEGSFNVWSGNERVELVASLAENGILEQSAELELLLSGTLTEAEASSLAEKLMTEWLDAPVDHVSFRTIMEKIWGTFKGWTLEQKAWYTQTLTDAGIQSPDVELFVLPDDDVISQKDAEMIARVYGEIWTNAAPGTFDSYDIVAEYIIFPHTVEKDGKRYTTTEGAKPVWIVEIGTPYRQGNTMYVEIDPQTGNADFLPLLIEAVYDRLFIDIRSPKVIPAIGDMQAQQSISSFFSWTMEAKAQWSEVVRPQLLSRKEGKPRLNDVIADAFSQYRYGLPGEHSLPQSVALKMAENAISNAYGITEADLLKYGSVYIYYDITNPAAPLWRFHFSMQGAQAVQTFGSLYDMINYRVEVDAQTGETLSLESYLLKDFPGYQAIMKWV